MQAYIRNNARTRYLPTSGLNELAKDIAHLCLTHRPAEVLVNLSDNDLTLTSVRELAKLLDKDKHVQGLLALDLSLNQIQASWEEIISVIANLLKKPLVQNLNLSLNFLPALETLDNNAAVKQELYSHERRLSLGYDKQMLVGEPDVDYWTQNAWEFKRIAFGLHRHLQHALRAVIQVWTLAGNTSAQAIHPNQRPTDKQDIGTRITGCSLQGASACTFHRIDARSQCYGQRCSIYREGKYHLHMLSIQALWPRH